MSDIVTLEAERKTASGTGAARAVRRAGRVPCIVYGGDAEPMMATVESRLIERYLNQPGFYSRLFDLAIDGRTDRVIAREVQLHPVKDKPLHIDFLRVSAGETITVAVPVHFINENQAPGIRRGGMLNAVRHEIEVTCPVDAIPASIEIDLTGLEIGDSVHISAVTLPAGVTPTITDRDFTVATIVAPSGMRDADVAGEPSQPPSEAEATQAKDEE